MSILVAKSQKNLSSAKLLVENNCFDSSVHCSYYSSVQLMIHLLLNKFNFNQETLENSAKKENKGSHVFAKNYLFTKMKEQNHRFKAVNFNRLVGELKNKRELADYHEEHVGYDFCNEAMGQADEINSILIDVFNLER